MPATLYSAGGWSQRRSDTIS